MKSSNANSADVVVIGAGLSGLAVACRAAGKGRRVLVMEQASTFGGKAGQLEMQGFTFDTGPSLFTMPNYVDEVFTDCGKNPRNYYDYQQLQTLCHYFYPDGTFLKADANKEKFAAEIERKTNDSSHSVLRFLSTARQIHQITEHIFIRRSLHKLQTYLRWATLTSLLRIGKLKVFQKMEAELRRYFKDERVIQLFSRYATYNGSNPYSAPATLNVIPHLEFGIGAYMPHKGIRDIPSALYQLAQDLGVEFQFNQEVERIVEEGNQVKGVEVNGEFIAAPEVVCNADIIPAYRDLLSSGIPKKLAKQERSSSALIFYWGMNESFAELDVHNIFFSGDYRAEFSQLFESKTLGSDPTVYVHVSAKVCSGHAPQGAENWFVMINAPHVAGQDWSALIPEARSSIIRKLSAQLGKPIEDFIACEHVLDPQKIEQQTSSYLGSLYGTSSNSRYAAFLRHANFNSKIKGLYFCGGSVHPGGGIPMVMNSARIVAEMLS